MATDKNNSIEILLVEDNPNDVELTRIAFEQHKLFNKLNVVSNGEDAMDYLLKKGRFNNARRPDIVILDLLLPGKHGLEVLKEIKQDPVLEDIPVVVLSSSDNREHIEEAYASYASCYVTKPLDFRQFVIIVQSLNNFWLSIVALPPKK